VAKIKNVVMLRQVMYIVPHYCTLCFVSRATYLVVKGKCKVHPRRGHDCPEEEQKYSSTLSLNSALYGGECSTPSPGRFTPGKESRYPLYMRLDGTQSRSGLVRKISLPPGLDPRTVQRVANRYTD